MLTDIASTTFPAYCQSCGRLADEGGWVPLLCERCAESFPFWDGPVPVPSPLDGGRALSRFEGPAKSLLVGLKYRGLLRAGWAFGAHMAATPEARSWLQWAALIVPIPLHWRRRWARGHNQAMTLVRGLVRNDEGRTTCTALRRVRPTRAQVGLGRVDRQHNVMRAFAAKGRHAAAVRGACILLVDDVVTTGATAAAAAKALKQAGADEVRLYAAAWRP
jgi:ComF family protein